MMSLLLPSNEPRSDARGLNNLQMRGGGRLDKIGSQTMLPVSGATKIYTNGFPIYVGRGSKPYFERRTCPAPTLVRW